MSRLHGRRRFLAASAGTVAALGIPDLSFISQLTPVARGQTTLPAGSVRFGPDIEPFVKLLEDSPRERVLEEVAARIKGGTNYREVVTALLLAGVRNIQPRPVGFKFHAVLVVNSALMASQASAPEHRWLPIFWAIDAFKDSQTRDVREGNWTMSAVDEKAVPSPDKAAAAFGQAMDNWDESAADVAAAGLARSATPEQVFEIFCRYGMRDFRDIGHKAIYVANSWRTLRHIGWQHSEPVLRSLAYALLEHEGDNPSRRDAEPDRPIKHSTAIAGTIRADWANGNPDSAASAELLETLRTGTSSDAANKVVELLNKDVAPQSIWEALFNGSGELMMRNPDIRSLHAVTTTNAMHFAFGQTSQDQTKRLLMLQNASFLPLFRGNVNPNGTRIDRLEPLAPQAQGPDAVGEILADITRDRMTAARKLLAWSGANPQSTQFIDAARLLIFLKGRDSHDYKFSAAIMEDYSAMASPSRERFLAASVYNLKGSDAPDNQLVQRTRAALAG